MMQELEGKIAIVTGAARGMGLSHARALGHGGATVVLTDVLDGGEASAASLAADGIAATFRTLDVREPGAWADVVGRTVAEHGGLDVLVNNAGIISAGGVVDEDLDTWNRVIAVNQTGVFLGMQHGIAAMRANPGGRGGSVINVASVLGVRGASDYVAYQASKAAVLAMTRSAAHTHAREGIRVNAVCPGTIQTPMHDGLPADANDEDLERTPMARVGEPEEVSAAIVFLASDAASFITGTAIHVDGGYLA